MFSPNKNGNNGNLKLQKRNYIFEKRQKTNIINEIKSGGIIKEKFKDIWRGKTRVIC